MPMYVVLVDPNGREWVAGSVIEVNNLLAEGYRFKGTAPARTDQLTSGPERPTNAPSSVADPEPVTNTGQTAQAGNQGSGSA